MCIKWERNVIMEAVNLNEPMDHSLGEPLIIKRILGGEKELYEILVRRNNQKLYRVIRAYLKDDAEIEDAMQDSYIKAYTKLYQFKLDSSFSTWLVRIGINQALARLREKGRLRSIDSRGGCIPLNAAMELPDPGQPNPQQRMVHMETRQILERAIDNLDPKYRMVYILKDVEGMELKDIALALDLTLANVKIRLHRSREMLKGSLYCLSVHEDVFEFGNGNCDRITEKVMRSLD